MSLNPEFDDMSRGYVDGVDISQIHVDEIQIYRHVIFSATRSLTLKGGGDGSAPSIGLPERVQASKDAPINAQTSERSTRKNGG
uniref:Uncharacterized protein n=1 Tax=Agrobacterium albertimagni TaxID=147266 RepID=A0A7C1NTB4_9HYPH